LFRRAIVRPPGSNFAAGLTTMDLGAPDYGRALAQHAAYCDALERCGLTLTRLPEDTRHPDSTFVEDTAVLLPGRAVLTRPGASSRAGEVAAIQAAVSAFHPRLSGITAPGTLDGGDVCETDDRFLIGISRRTNEEGARQLAAILAEEGFTSERIDIRTIEGILHLKSGLSYVGEGRAIAIGALARHRALKGYEVIEVEAAESYSANCLRVNDRILIAGGHPMLAAALRRLGYDLISLDMAEFQKMDGGLSCLSLRF
jgi:dimethylargininase